MLVKVFLYQDRGAWEPCEKEAGMVKISSLTDIEKVAKELYEKFADSVLSVDFKIDEHNFKDSFFNVEVLEMP